MMRHFLVFFRPSQPNGGDMFKNASMPTNNPFLMPGHPFPLAAAAAAAAAASTPKDNNPFPFFRPPQNMMDQVTQTQQALLSMMRNAQQQQQHLQQQQQQKEHLKRAAAAVATASLTLKKEDVLDLSSSSPSPKRARKSSGISEAGVGSGHTVVSLCNLVSPCSHEAREVKSWSIDDVCKFVSSVEHCQPFVEVNSSIGMIIGPWVSKGFRALLFNIWWIVLRRRFVDMILQGGQTKSSH